LTDRGSSVNKPKNLRRAMIIRIILLACHAALIVFLAIFGVILYTEGGTGQKYLITVLGGIVASTLCIIAMCRDIRRIRRNIKTDSDKLNQ
jgi:hypothetical protein